MQVDALSVCSVFISRGFPNFLVGEYCCRDQCSAPFSLSFLLCQIEHKIGVHFYYKQKSLREQYAWHEKVAEVNESETNWWKVYMFDACFAHISPRNVFSLFFWFDRGMKYADNMQCRNRAR